MRVSRPSWILVVNAVLFGVAVASSGCGGNVPPGGNAGTTTASSGAAQPSTTGAGPGGSSAGTTGAPSTTSAGASTTGSVSGTSGTAGATATSSSGTSSGGSGTTGEPVAAVNVNSLAFGAVSCGSQAAPQSVTLSDLGGGSFTYQASLGQGAGSPYQLTLNPSGTVTAASSATITVAPVPVAAQVALPASYDDTLTIDTVGATNDATPLVVSLTESAQGVILAFNVSNIPFGSIPTGSSQSSTFQLSNSGNVPAQATLKVGLTDAGVDPFSVSPNTQATIGAAGQTGNTLAGDVTFSPTSSSAVAGTVSVSLASGTASCQPLPTLSVSGTGQTGGVALSTNALNFDDVPCGADAGAQSFALTNSGNASLTYSAKLGLLSSSPYTLSCSPPTNCGGATASGGVWSGTLAAAAVATFTVTPDPIPPSAPTSADYFGDSVVISTDVVGDPGHSVALSETASGAVLSFSPTSIQFGDVPVTTSTNESFTVINSGNANANVTAVSSNPANFPVSPGASTPVGGAASGDFAATFSPGISTSPQAANVSLSVDSNTVLCAPLPGASGGPALLSLSGTGSNGTVAYSPSGLAFGLVNCGAVASPQQITFSNTGNQAYTVSAALDAGTAYSFVISTDGGVVAADGGTAIITVTPLSIPQTSAVPGSYDDTLTVTTSVSGDGAHVIPLTESAQGVVLQGFSPANGSIVFPNTPQGAQSSYPLYVQNTGNVAALLVLTLTSGSPSIFSFDTGSAATVPAGASLNFNAYFDPATNVQYSGQATLGVAPGTVLCAPLPPPPLSSDALTLSGLGTSTSTLSASPTSIGFGEVPCGSASASKNPSTITLSNKAVSSADWTAALSNGTGSSSYFQLSATAGTVPSNGTGTLNVTALPLPSATIPPGPISDTLTVTSGTNTIQIPLGETAYGAVLAFDPQSYTFKSCGILGATSTTFAVDNTGIYTGTGGCATVDLSIGNDPRGELTLSSSSGQSCNLIGAFTFTAKCSAFSATAETASIGLTVPPTGGPVCGPAASPMSVTIP